MMGSLKLDVLSGLNTSDDDGRNSWDELSDTGGDPDEGFDGSKIRSKRGSIPESTSTGTSSKYLKPYAPKSKPKGHNKRGSDGRERYVPTMESDFSTSVPESKPRKSEVAKSGLKRTEMLSPHFSAISAISAISADSGGSDSPEIMISPKDSNDIKLSNDSNNTNYCSPSQVEAGLKNVLDYDTVQDNNFRGMWPSALNGYNPTESSSVLYLFKQTCNSYSSVYDELNRSTLAKNKEWEHRLRIFMQHFFGYLKMLFITVVVVLQEILAFLLWINERLILETLIVLGERFFKPMLNALFNGLLHPFFVILRNISLSLVKVLEPLEDVLDVIARPLSRVLRSISLVNINNFNGPRIAPSKGENMVKMQQ